MHVHFRNDPVKPDVSLANGNAALLEPYGVVGSREMGGDFAESALSGVKIYQGKREGLSVAAKKGTKMAAKWLPYQ